MPCTSYPNLVTWTVVQTGLVCPLVEGDPGGGKSKTTAAFFARCAELGLCLPYMHTLVGSLLQPTDFAIPCPSTKNPGSLDLLCANWVGTFRTLGGGFLFMDEFKQLAPAQQTPIMRIVCEKVVGDTPLPERLWMLAACNSTAVSANGSELEPPLANRVLHLAWEDDHEGWERAMLNGGRFAPPQFIPLPDDWEKHLPKYSALIAAFHKHLPGRLMQIPTERSKLSGPWPSKRSWTNGAICMAALAAIDAEDSQRYKALTGCVGEEVSLEYQNWERLLDLPDPERWLGLAIAHRQGPKPAAGVGLDIPNSCDRVMAALSSLVDRVKNHNLDAKTGRPAEARWLAAIDCFAETAKCWMEPAIATAAGLFTADILPHKDALDNARMIAKAPRDFCNEVLAIHQNIKAALKL